MMMKEYWHKAKNWYAALEQRERRAVLVGGSSVMFAVLYFGIWSPMVNHVDDMRKRIVTDQKTLTWMREADEKIKQLAATETTSQQAVTPVQLLTLLQMQINQAGLRDALKEMKQASNDAIQLHFKNVSFDQLIKLLMSVLKNSHVAISQFAATAETTPGMVNADVMLTIT
jgi:general secretion pathway protein M